MLSIRVFIPSGAGSPGFGGIAECLRELNDIAIFAGDTNPNAYGKNLADGFCTMPASDDPNYSEAVLANAKRFNCQVVLPVTTRELLPLSNLENTLRENGIAMAITPPGAMELVNNKARLYQFMQEQQLPCVSFKTANSKTAFLEALKALGFPAKKVIMKPSGGNGSRGFRILCTEAEMQSTYFNSKAGTVNTSMAAVLAEMPETFPFEMLLSDYLPGEEYSVDLLADRGTMLGLAIRLRSKTVSGISVQGVFVKDEAIEKQCRILTGNLDLHGPIGIQFKRDEHGLAKILEINPRLQGAVSTARFAGINFPVFSVQLALGMQVQVPACREGVAFNRYWKDIQNLG